MEMPSEKNQKAAVSNCQEIKTDCRGKELPGADRKEQKKLYGRGQRKEVAGEARGRRKIGQGKKARVFVPTTYCKWEKERWIENQRNSKALQVSVYFTWLWQYMFERSRLAHGCAGGSPV